MDVKFRQKVERSIVRRVVLDAIKAGLEVNINNGGDGFELQNPTNKSKVILQEMFATDEEHLVLYKDGKFLGWVFFVYGNSGWDVICDYSSSWTLEELMKNANELANKWEDKCLN